MTEARLVTLHQYLHDEAVWPDEDHAWHLRVCEGIAALPAAAPAEELREALVNIVEMAYTRKYNGRAGWSGALGEIEAVARAALARHESEAGGITSGAGESRETGGGPPAGYDVEAEQTNAPRHRPRAGDDERPSTPRRQLPFGVVPAEIRGTAPAPECLPQAHRYDVSSIDPDLLICRRCGKERPA